MAMLPNPLPQLADDPTGSVLGLRLPPGTLVDMTIDGQWHEPLLWYADGPAAPDAWEALLPARAAGLHPVLIELDEKGHDGPGDWDLMPQETSYPGDYDPEEILADAWDFDDEPDDEELEFLEPYGREWPGLAPKPSPGRGGATDLDADDRAAEITADLIRTGWLDDPRAALVHARRSADIPAAIGWSGPVNHESDVAVLCAVLRSWEDRFGIRVIALSFDRLTVSVAVPPTTLEDAEAVAAEHYAFCPDNIEQGDHDTLGEYAEKAVLGKHTWHFWWD